MSRNDEEIYVKVTVKLGPVSVEFESRPGDRLVGCDESAFTQKVLALRNFFGDPSEAREVLAPSPTSMTPPLVAFNETPQDDDDDDILGVSTPSGERVGRIGGVKFTGRVDGEE